jgi:hypothetical protein
MKSFYVVSALLGFLFLGCTGKQGPSGPTGSSGAPAPNTFQTSFQNGVYPNASYSGELDTWLSGTGGSPTTANPYLEVNSGSAIVNYARTILRFDISSLPTNVTVLSAEIWLKLESATTVGSSPITIGLHNFASDTFSGCQWTINAGWTQDGLTGWSACTGDTSPGQEGYINPTTISTVVFSSAVNGTSNFYKWSLSPSVVQSWLTNSNNNNGLILKSEGEFGETASTVGFYPYNGTTGDTPLLIVEYQ